MDEGQVDYTIRCSRAAPQAVQVLQITAMHLGAGGGKRFGPRLRAGKTKHLMAGRDQVLDDGRADEASRAGNENTHERISG